MSIELIAIFMLKMLIYFDNKNIICIFANTLNYITMLTEKEKLIKSLSRIKLSKITREELSEVFETLVKEQEKQELQKQIDELQKKLEKLG